MMLRRAIILIALTTLAGVIACGDLDGAPNGASPNDPTLTMLERLEQLSEDQVENRCKHDSSYRSTDRGLWQTENYLRWSPDGSRILFDVSVRPCRGRAELPHWGPVDLYSVNADGSGMRRITDSRDRKLFHGSGVNMTYFDVSPDSTHIVYSTCGLSEVLKPGEGDIEWIYDYEIMISKIDGTEVNRLTENTYFDNFPVWSPDGTSIAFISEPDGPSHHSLPYMPTRSVLTIYTLATGESRNIVPSINGGIAAHRPAWSPDGHSIAFVAAEREGPSPNKRAVYTVGVDGSGLTRISDAASGPAWSPDGRRIAVAVPEDKDRAALYTFAADGSDPVMVDGNLPDPWRYPVEPWMGDLSWSPDGSEILFDGFAHIVALDGSPAAGSLPMYLRRDFPDAVPMLAAWSPDGSKVVIRTTDPSGGGHEFLMYIMDRDGTNSRALVKSLGYRLLVPVASSKIVDVDAEPCFNHITVHGPKVNSGLVQDCLALLDLRDKLTGFSPDWSYEQHMGEWEGVRLRGSDYRVIRLYLRDSGLTGALPPEIWNLLSNLTELSVLDLSSNDLSGPIPPEMGNLTEFRWLNLSSNNLSGPIPPELGNLPNFEHLDLGHNQLSGSIPPELGNLPNFEYLDLGHNQLSGSIPPELGNLTNLGVLYLSHNQLSGSIPPELGNLATLYSLDLSHTDLSGTIPVELAGLVRLLGRPLINGTNLSGCVPAELPVKWLLSHWDGGLALEHCDQAAEGLPYDLDVCSAGTLVPDPKANPGLVEDCEALVEILNNSFEEYRDLSWSIRAPITHWQGVWVEGSPLRVRRLWLENRELTSIPPEFGKLSQLSFLSLEASYSVTGRIPPELGNLKELERLVLYHTHLSGSIPPELGNLTKLQELYLSHTDLSGPIPPELGNLVNLRSLSLMGADLSGPIPPELGELVDLKYLNLAMNEFTGSIPPELGNLTNLREINLHDNQLTGCIPPALWNVEKNDLHKLPLPDCEQVVSNQ